MVRWAISMEEQARECGFVKKGLSGNDMNYASPYAHFVKTHIETKSAFLFENFKAKNRIVYSKC